MIERTQLESAVAGNQYLRGLLAIPFGAVLIAAGLGNMEWGPFAHLWLVPATVAVAAGAYALVLRYYNDHYGRVTPHSGARTAASVAVAAVMVGGSVLVQALGLPLNAMAVSWAAIVLGYYGCTVGLKPHHVVIWGAVLVSGLVPLWPDPATGNTANVGLLLVGAAAIATGVLDHRLLVRTFGPPEALEVGDGSVGE